MHLVLPFAAALSDAGALALHSLRLPHLEQLLSRLEPAAVVGTDEYALNLPHEHALAALRGWPSADGCLPFAAAAARADGLPVAAAGEGWGLLTPTHWQVGREQIVLCDPAELALDEAESRAFWQLLQPLFEELGWVLRWGAPLRWYATHASLATLRSASLERVIGRPIDPWLPERMAGRQLRQLQSEVQMLLHTHPLNAEREARGALPVNSFWLSGSGRVPADSDAPASMRLDERLRGPWLAEDWAAWAEAWHTLDALLLADLNARAARGEPVSLTLAGERFARRFDSVQRSAWQRLARHWQRTPASGVLESL